MSQERALKRVAALTSTTTAAQSGLNVVEHFHSLTEEQRLEILGAALELVVNASEFSALAGMMSTYKIAGDVPLRQPMAVQTSIGPHTVTVMVGFTDAALEALEAVE